MRTLFLLLVLALTACKENVRVIDRTGVETVMPADVYAHQLSTEAFKTSNTADAECQKKATTELWAAICGLTARAGSGNNVPQYIPKPDVLDRVAQFTPLILGGAQIFAGDRANARQTKLTVDLAAVNAIREVNIVTQATETNARIATTGFNAVSNTAQTGFNALAGTAQNASNNAASTANNTASTFGVALQVVANTFAKLPPAVQTIDNSVNSGIRVAGNNNETARRVECNSRSGPGGYTIGQTSSSIPGAAPTNPASTAYNALAAAPSGVSTNNCGGG